MGRRTIAGLAILALACGPVGGQAATPVTLADLSAAEQEQLRCTMLAGAILYDVERGVSANPHGIDDALMERLGEALAARLNSAHGTSDDDTRALLKADFERFAARAAEQEPGWYAAQADACHAMWSAPPLPPAPMFGGEPVDAPFCHALWTTFAGAIGEQAGKDSAIAQVFAARAERIADDLSASGEDSDVAAEAVMMDLDRAAARFDPQAFDALDEEEAETIMLWCEQRAGPDD